MTERRKASLLTALAALALAAPARAADAPVQAAAPAASSGATLTLKRCIELALKHYPRIHEALAKARAKRADIDIAHYAPYTEFYATAALAPAPTVRGTNIFSPNTDAALTSNMGLAWQMGVEGTVPLWTFGKITNLWDAAEASARAGEHAVDKEKNELRLAVRRAYFAAKVAQDGLSIVSEAMRQVDRYLPSLERKVSSGDADEIDLLKLRIQRAELEARESEARRHHATALAALRFLTGYTGQIALSSEPLVRAKHELGPLPRYLTAARLYRPEVNMVRAGILAQEAQLRLERARYFPDLGIAIVARYARAPEVTDQRNPYANDRSNQLGYGAGLVLNYKLDFLPQTARVARAEAELESLRASERFALGGVGVEVEEAFREAEDAKRRLDAWTRATDLTERWMNQVERRIAAGAFDEKEVLEPTKELALKRFGRLSAIFDYNIAMAKLAQATGWDQGIADE
jgi:outer membrane protein TolC